MYVLEADDPAAQLARIVERDVFYETFGNTPELLEPPSTAPTTRPASSCA